MRDVAAIDKTVAYASGGLVMIAREHRQRPLRQMASPAVPPSGSPMNHTPQLVLSSVL